MPSTPDLPQGQTRLPRSADPTFLVCQTIFDLFDSAGTWPTWDRLDDALDTRRGVNDPWALVSKVDRSLLYGFNSYEPTDDQVVGLSIAGLARVPSASEDLRIFLKTLVAISDALVEPVDWTSTEQRPELRIDPEWVTRHVDLPAAGRDRLLSRQVAIWQTAGLASVISATPSVDGAWSMVPNRKQVRRYRGVSDVHDYLRLQAGSTATVPAPLHGVVPDNEVGPASTSSTLAPARSQVMSITTHEGFSFTIDLDEPLGSGGSGTVFAGADTFGAQVAVKRVSLPRSFDTTKWMQDARYAEREYDALMTVAPNSEQHVVPLLGHLVEDDHFILVYPRAEFSLADVVALVAETATANEVADGSGAAGPKSARRPTSPAIQAARRVYGSGPSPEELRDIALQLATGLAQIHEAGVVHRDLKPGNALFLNGRWCWTDLGIARIVSEATSTYTWREHGTPAFQAPEAAGGGTAVHRSDVYSLACTLHAVMFGRPPFEGPHFSHQHRTRLPDLYAVNDTGLRLLLSSMLKKEAAGRPSAEEVVAMLQASPGRLSSPLQDLSLRVQRRDDARAQTVTRAAARERAIIAARDQFDLIWSGLSLETSAAGPSITFTSGQDAWIMRMGDRRLVVTLAEAHEKDGPALILGLVTVEALEVAETTLESEVANIAAVLPSAAIDAELEDVNTAVPIWRLFRMASNFIATNKVPVSSSRSDGRGAIGLQHLDTHLARRPRPGLDRPAVVADEETLTAEALLGLFINEVRAIDEAEIDSSGS